ncbi:carbohydrate kinase [Draconibacterium sp. IB214405]|uniref:carbohydrate kinase family protein n=1 Tax=Draconibacterium sp. IB214405 TaxID=3097352 RepID=UPI002A138CDE|nr:carbohydrate kinase [Draconibacterium sp. IB214405]MDX8338884.1 carbohydrate kinase [Draconibacterium sp. IB214405]
MNIKSKQILCIGEVLWDRLPTGAKPGGAPMNVALHLNAIGLDVTVASSVGNDQLGEELKQFLENSGVITDYIQSDANLPTSEVLVHLDENNNASYEICEPVAWDNICLTDALQEKAKQAGLMIYGSLASRNPETRNTLLTLLENDAVKLIDVNFRKPYDKQDVVELLLEKTDIIKLNDDELLVFAGWHNKAIDAEKELVKWFAAYYKVQMVCVTKGEKGALLYFDGDFYEHPGFKVTAVDTVGAGDAFLAGIVAALLQKKEPQEALAFACATGAFVASKAGATPKYDMEEIKRIMNP